MKKLFALIAIVLAVIVLLPVLQTCNVPALQAQALIESARAQSETAKAAQAAAGAANTMALFFGLAVVLVVACVVGLVALVIWTRVRREMSPRSPAGQGLELQRGYRAGLLVSQPQPPQLAAGDPIQQLIQLELLERLGRMNQRAEIPPAQLAEQADLQTQEWPF